MLARLGRVCYAHRKAVAGGWVLLLVFGFVVGGAVFGRLEGSDGAASAESVQGDRLLSSAGTGGPQVIALVDGTPVDDPALARSVTSTAAAVRRIDGVRTVSDYYEGRAAQLRATDGRASAVVVELRRNLPGDRFDTTLATVERTLRGIRGAEVSLGGSLLLDDEVDATVQDDLARGERLSLPIVLVVLVVVFGGVVAASLPLLAALGSIAGALLLLLGLSYVIDLDSNVVSVTTVMGLGLAIDYSLLVVNRYREERGAGADVPGAIERTMRTAGRTITFSALTVAVSLGALFVFDDPTYRAIGGAGVSIVLLALAAGLTLVPALIALTARRIKAPTEPVRDDGRFFRFAHAVQRRPWPVALVTAGLLAVAAAPLLSATYTNGGPELLPKDFESRKVADAQARFPGRPSDPLTVVARAPLAAMTAYADRVRPLPGVADVTAPAQLRDGVVAVDVYPDGPTQGAVAQRLVGTLRGERPDFRTYITGDAAFLVDFKREIRAGLPWALGLIALASFVLLYLMTGSVVIPVKALVMNVLSLGFPLGALVWVFQDGHLSSWLGFEAAGSVQTWVPIIVFVFAYGLSMDYEVFLLARIKELRDAGYPTREAVAVGLQRSGRIITLAAVLIVIVFSGFAAGQMLGIKQMGLGLALAVLVDATLIRCLLVPATMSLLGEANWWAPAPLRRLHDRFGVSESGPAVRGTTGGSPPAVAIPTPSPPRSTPSSSLIGDQGPGGPPEDRLTLPGP